MESLGISFFSVFSVGSREEMCPRSEYTQMFMVEETPMERNSRVSKEQKNEIVRVVIDISSENELLEKIKQLKKCTYILKTREGKNPKGDVVELQYESSLYHMIKNKKKHLSLGGQRYTYSGGYTRNHTNKDALFLPFQEL